LDALHTAGLVEPRPRPAHGRGRPATAWALTDLAAELFPDRHAELTVELIDSVRRALGQSGVDQVVAERTRGQIETYRAAMPRGRVSLARRADALAAIRAGEGYVAEVVPAPDGDGLILVEHHCPICEAASACTNLCSAELELFRTVMGDDVEVTRTQHLLSGDQRCAYRLRSTA
jgi:predicted ArsR family transcriptional regulator